MYEGKLLTARDTAAGADVAEADQDGEYVESGMELYEVEQPPFITIGQFHSVELESLTPPEELVRDWNEAVMGMSLVKAWEETNYEQRYKQHIEDTLAAQNQIDQIKSDLNEGKEVVIISGSSLYPLCPRRILYEIITEEQINHDLLHSSD